MEYTQKYCLVAFYDPTAIGTEFRMNDWPLHITIADVFAIDRLGTNIDADLKETMSALPIFEAVAKNEEIVLGDALAVLLEGSSELQSLHDLVVVSLKSNGAKFNSPQFTHNGFLPHCTTQKHKRLNNGDRFKIHKIAMIDMFPDGNWQNRKVLNIFKLSKK